jgi:hypothetical protein
MSHRELSADELNALIQRVFQPGRSDRRLAILVDLPDEVLPDNPDWAQRRQLAAGWASELIHARETHGLAVSLFLYRNVRANNADLPDTAWPADPSALPGSCQELERSPGVPMSQLLSEHQLVIAPTELSTTAPLKMLAPKHGFRAATMPGFSPAMVPALRLDYTEIDRRVRWLKEILDRAVAADFEFTIDSSSLVELHLDLRHRTAHASGGLFPSPGVAGNLPSGEAYIVPYEGELDGDPTSSGGTLPIQTGDEVVAFRIEGNRAVEVLSQGLESDRARHALLEEPASGNVAELGLGVLADFGIEPIGEVLLDEKLGLHLAFGRSEHFGGQVGPTDFSRPEAVVHQDHVYLPEIQPRIVPTLATLALPDGGKLELMRDGSYVIDFDSPEPG